MPTHFYRFRSTAALLGDRQELEQQEIYFAPPDQLNDALEGFTNVVWRGDRILWRSLLRHYLLALLQLTYFVVVGGPKFDPSVIGDLVGQVESDLPQAPIRDVYRELSEEFLADALPKAWIEGLSAREAVLSREELAGYLHTVHPFALACVITAFERRGMRVTTAPMNFQPILEQLPLILQNRFDVHDKAGDAREDLLAAADALLLQSNLLSDVNDEHLIERRGWMFIYRDFPGVYLRAIERLMFPDWYTACFVKHPTHAAMWGVYADGHRGVCLEFRTRPDAERRPTLILNGPVGFSGNQEGVRMLTGDRTCRFEPVRYASDYPETDFFRNLGILSRYKLESFWFCDGDGRVSDGVKDILAEDEGWRRSYWERHAQATTTKLPQWAHEEEYRLLLSGSLVDRKGDVANRKMRYRLEDLAGVIFGIKTSEEHKIAILRILKAKADAVGGARINFRQAAYSHGTGRIELSPLPFISKHFGVG